MSMANFTPRGLLSVMKKRQALFFPLFDIALNGLNYFFHIFISWHLIPMQYGILNALLAVVTILFVTGMSMQVMTAKNISRAEGNAKEEINKSLFYAGWFSVLFSIGFLAALPLIVNITHAGIVEVLLVIVIFMLNTILCTLRGVFQGRKMFLYLNASLYTEGIFKIAFLVLFIGIFKDIKTALLSILIGMVASLLHALYFNREIIDLKIIKSLGKFNKKVILTFFTIFMSNFFLYYFTSVDMIVVNWFLPKDSGIYAVVLRYSQLINFAFFSLITVLFPSISSIVSNREVLKKRLMQYFVFFILIDVVISAVYFFFMPMTVVFLFGKQYSSAGGYLILGAAAYMLLAMNFFLVNISIAIDNKIYVLYLFLTSVLLTILYVVFSKSISQVLLSAIGVYFILFVILTITIFKEVYSNGRNHTTGK